MISMRIGIDTFVLMWVLLIVLKACGVAPIGWLGVVLFPIWVPIAVISVVLAAVFAFSAIALVGAGIILLILKVLD